MNVEQAVSDIRKDVVHLPVILPPESVAELRHIAETADLEASTKSCAQHFHYADVRNAHLPNEELVLDAKQFPAVHRVAESKAILMTLAKEESTPLELREKLQVVDDAALADIVLNSVTNNTGIQVVIPSMMQVKHLQTNVAAMEHSRFTADERRRLRDAMTFAV